ncbi:MAG TPA: DinB family protein [Trueperaceae bacterium]|nr:DinB family protein [Trueperaceae bacterium]
MAQRNPLDLEREVLEAFEHALKVTELVVSEVPDEYWHAPPPQKGRTIAAIVQHVHSLRRTFTKLAKAPVGPSLPAKTVTKEEALAALAENRETLVALFRDAIAEKRGRVPGMPKRTAMMMAYLMQHDAHHRGQVTRQLSEFGYQLSGEATSRIWGWRTLDR